MISIGAALSNPSNRYNFHRNFNKTTDSRVAGPLSPEGALNNQSSVIIDSINFISKNVGMCFPKVTIPSPLPCYANASLYEGLIKVVEESYGYVGQRVAITDSSLSCILLYLEVQGVIAPVEARPLLVVEGIHSAHFFWGEQCQLRHLLIGANARIGTVESNNVGEL